MGVETALLVAGIVATVAGTGVAVAGQVQAGKAADKAAKATAQAENANAKAAQDAAALEAGQVRRRNLLRLGSNRANAGKSGVLIDDSAADVIYDSAIQGELEALSTLYSGASQASYYKSRGSIARLEGANAKSASRIGAASTLIGGVGATATQVAKMPKFKGEY
jgi:hypothetical protein